MMLTMGERTLVETLRSYFKKPDLRPTEGRTNDALHIEGDLGTGWRRVTLDHLSKDYLAGEDESRRASVVARLFVNATNWPEETFEVRCVHNGYTPLVGRSIAFRVFIDDVPVSDVVSLPALIKGHSTNRRRR